jgi:diguanylate cyclase (GGDEF)-like protein
MFFGARKTNPKITPMPGITKLPNASDVQAIWEEASTHKGRSASLRWTFGKPPRNYSLTVAADALRPDEALMWTFSSTDGSETVTHWTETSSDYTTVHGRVLAEFPKEEIPAIVHTDEDLDESIPLPSDRLGPHPTKDSMQNPKPGSGQGFADLTSSGLASGGLATGGLPTGAPANGDHPNGELASPESHKPERREEQAASSEEQIQEGELAKVKMSKLLESVAKSRRTGKLEIQHKAGTSEAFFKDGFPVHAWHEGLEGDSAIIELIGLKEGSYKFVVKEPPEQKTVHKRLDLLLQDRAALDHYDNYLKQQGLKDGSCLKRLYPGLSEQEFEAAVGQAAPADMRLQKQIYLSIDGKTTLLNILKKNSLSRFESLPALFNLLACKLVVIYQPKREPVPISTAAIDLDRHVLQSLRKTLTRSETSLYTYPTFLLFLEQEMARFVTHRRPFSLVTIRMSFKDLDPNDLSMQEAAVRALSEPLTRISGFKRNSDIFCHYKTSDYVLILPETDSITTTQLTTHMAEQLKDCSLTGPDTIHTLTLQLGTVSVPEDGETLEKILAMAESYQKVF